MSVDLHGSAMKLLAELNKYVAQALEAGLLSRRTRSIPDQSMWDMYWTKWHWDTRFHPITLYEGYNLVLGHRILS
jgi:hypothetical protein